jgi:hypothetical protein
MVLLLVRLLFGPTLSDFTHHASFNEAVTKGPGPARPPRRGTMVDLTA